MPGLPTTDKRFRRAHVKPLRKRSPAAKYVWLTTKFLATALVLGYAGYRGVTLIAAASSLQIGHMVVRGHERLSTGEVLSGENIKRPLVHTSTRRVTISRCAIKIVQDRATRA